MEISSQKEAPIPVVNRIHIPLLIDLIPNDKMTKNCHSRALLNVY